MKQRIVSVILLSAMLLLTLTMGVTAAEEHPRPTVTGEPGPHIIHKVKWGETLSWISWMYRVPIQVIVEANHIRNRDLIWPGQRLIIPLEEEEEYVEYIVQPGDMLSVIAARFHVRTWDIARRNGIWNINLIYVGQKLIIPGGGEEPPHPRPPAPHQQAEIVISSPTNNAEVTTPVTVTGWGRGTENQLAVDVLDETGAVIGQGFVTVNAEVGQYGPFTGEITFTAPATEQLGRIAVYRVSARDGAIEALTSVTVTLKP